MGKFLYHDLKEFDLLNITLKKRPWCSSKIWKLIGE